MANLYFRNTGNANWGTLSNWSLTDGGGATATALPSSTDDVFFTANSGNCDINQNASGRAINFTGYSNTLTFPSASFSLNANGNVTLSPSMLFGAPTSTGLRLNATCTLTSNGRVWEYGLGFFSGSSTYTLADDWTVTGTVTFNGLQMIVNGNSLFISGSLSVPSGSNNIVSGTTSLIINGTGTWTSSNGTIRNNLTINTTGTFTISGVVNYANGTLTYVANTGTVITTNSTLTIGFTGSNTTLNTSGMSWWNVYSSQDNTITLTSDLNVNNIFRPNFGSFTVNGAYNVNVKGNLEIVGYLLTGTATIVLNGTGAQSWTHSSAVYISNNLTINKPSGTLTISGTVYYETRTFTYTQGTISGAGTILFRNSTLNLGANKLNVNAALVGNITLQSDSTFGANLTTQTTAVVFSGAFAINVEGNLAINIATSGASTPIVLNGTGAQSWTHGSAVYLSNDLTINKASGTLTIGAFVYYVTRTLTYNNIGGTVDTTTNNSRLLSNASTTFVTDGIIWNNATFSGSTPTFTLTNNFTLSGTLTISSNAGTNTTISGADLNVGGLLVTNASNIVGSSILNFTGTGTWNHTAAGYIVKNININTSGTLTLGANIYYSVSTITYISGTVDSSTNSNTLNILLSNTNVWFTVNLDTSGMSWYNIALTSSGATARTFTLTSDLSILNNFTLTNGGVASTTTYTGNGSITCNALQPQPSNGNAFTLDFNNTNIYTNDLLTDTFTAGTGTTMNSANLYISRNIRIGNSNLLAPFGGTVQIYYVGTGTWTTNQTVANQSISASFTINTSGVLTLSRNVYFAGANTFTYRNGKVNTKNSTLNITGNSTFVNCNKINFNSVVITAGNTITMNEFFCGSPELQTAVSSTTTTNAIVTFTDNFEKIAKFVNMNGITFTRPQQLLLLTNQPKKTRNRGIRYNNSLANGVAKNDPSVQNLQTANQTKNLLVGDPSFSKTI